MKKIIWLILIIAIGYYGYTHWLPQKQDNNVEQAPINNESPVWLLYENNSYANYSIQYPSNWTTNQENEKTTFTSPLVYR